ncbi:MAG: hypothetical protein J6T43_12105 [Prevotella sp.]|nr:hypothetical protein [Prevotella sp.]
MDGNKNGSFWPSYVDIMTTLFAITLILFAVSYSRFKVKEKQLKSLVEQYENIIDVYSTVGKIDSTAYFGYDADYLKHLFSVDVEYQQKEYRIDKLKLDLNDKVAADNKRDSILEAGRLIKEKIIELDQLQTSIEAKDSIKNNIKFLIIIEGQASKVPFNMSDWQNNYTLSYLRAQFLNEFWKQNGINFESISKRCQLLISGSGEGGVPRYTPPVKEPKTKEEWELWNSWEGKNQRFLIQIVPVIGNIKFTKEEIDKLQDKK